MNERYIAAVDLGSSRTTLCVARIEGEDIQVVYYRSVPSSGIRYSYIYNPMKVEQPLKELLEDAERELGIKIHQVVTGLPRFYVRQETATGSMERANGTISTEEIANLKNISLDDYTLEDPQNDFIYGAVAQSFTTDDMYQAPEDDVVGTISDSLSGNFKVFIGSRKHIANMDKVFNDLSIAVAERFFVPDTTAKAVLTSDEMDGGVALLDLGAGASSVSIYKDGTLRHYGAIPFGGNSISADIRAEGGLSEKLAENIKLAYGSCISGKLASMAEKVLRITYEDSGREKEMSVHYLAEIIEARQREIIEALLYEIERSGYADDLRCGVVITGGGASMVQVGNLIKEMSGYTVRTGFPRRLYSSEGCIGVNDVDATTCMGMIVACRHDTHLNCAMAVEEEEEVEEETGDIRPDGSLFAPSEFGEAVKQKKKAEKKPKAPKQTRQTPGIWTKVSTFVDQTITGLYDASCEE